VASVIAYIDGFNVYYVRHEALSVREEVQDLLPCPVAAGRVKLRAV
jgi:hypothetical protein